MGLAGQGDRRPPAQRLPPVVAQPAPRQQGVDRRQVDPGGGAEFVDGQRADSQPFRRAGAGLFRHGVVDVAGEQPHGVAAGLDLQLGVGEEGEGLADGGVPAGQGQVFWRVRSRTSWASAFTSIRRRRPSARVAAQSGW